RSSRKSSRVVIPDPGCLLFGRLSWKAIQILFVTLISFVGFLMSGDILIPFGRRRRERVGIDSCVAFFPLRRRRYRWFVSLVAVVAEACRHDMTKLHGVAN